MENDEQVKSPLVFRASCNWVGFLAVMLFLGSWVVGWVLAKGFWSTLISVCLPPWGWYLIAEKIMIAYGLA